MTIKQIKMKEEIKRWESQADADLKSAKNSLKSKDYYLAAFMSQQSAEKILKALYLKKHNELRKIHDLTYFARNLELSEDLIGKCEELSKVYIETRYPDIGNGKIPAKKFSKSDSEKFLKIAKEVLKCVKKML